MPDFPMLSALFEYGGQLLLAAVVVIGVVIGAAVAVRVIDP